MANTPNVRFKGFTDDWEERKVKEVCSISTGKSNTQDKDDDGEYPFYVRSAIVEHSKKYLYDEEAVLTVGDGVGTGKVFHYVNGKYDLHQRCYRMFDFSEKLNAKYFYYIFSRMFYKRVMAMTAKTSVDSVRLEMIADMEIPVPVVNEQEKIGAYYFNLDNLITLYQRKCDETKELKKYMLQKMFPKNGELIPEIRFVGFTDDWEQSKLGELVEIKDSARIPNAEWSDSGVPYIRASDITNEDTQGVLFITFDRYEFYKNKTGAPAMGDVLFNGGGEIGKTLLKIDDKPIYVQGGAVLYARTSMSKTLVGQYLKTYFETRQAKNYMDAASAGGTMKHFTLKPSQEMPVMFPTIEEQKQIGVYFSHLDHLITLHQRKCDELKEVKRFMLQNMFPQKG